jgi:hypothetical protein
MRTAVIIFAALVYISGWSGAMGAMDMNVKDKGSRPWCDQLSWRCPLQMLIAAVWPIAFVAGPVFHMYRNEKTVSQP